MSLPANTVRDTS